MSWADAIADPTGLLPGSNQPNIRQVENELGIQFPDEFRQFLLLHDGGQIAQRRFIIYSAGTGLHPSETLLSANKAKSAEFPLVLVGRESEEEFGFRKEDLPSHAGPVYFYRHEEGEVDLIADSFLEFIKWMFRVCE